MVGSYGAVERQSGVGTGTMKLPQEKTFDADNMRYLDGGNARLTPKQRFRQIILVGVPILVAVCLVGGAALLLLKNFSHLYGPGGSNGHKVSSRVVPTPETQPSPVETPSLWNKPVVAPISTPVAPPQQSPSSRSSTTSTIPKKSDDTTTSTTTTTTKDATSKGPSSCSVHKNCSGLVGDCCPTDKGTFLDCCSN